MKAHDDGPRLLLLDSVRGRFVFGERPRRRDLTRREMKRVILRRVRSGNLPAAETYVRQLPAALRGAGSRYLEHAKRHRAKVRA